MIKRDYIENKNIENEVRNYKPTFPNNEEWKLKKKIHERVGIRGLGFYDILIAICQKPTGYLPISIRSLSEEYYPSISGVKNLIDIFVELGVIDIVVKSRGSSPTIYKVNAPNYLLGVPNVPSETITPIQQEPEPIKPVEVKKPTQTSTAPIKVLKKDSEMEELFASLPKKEEKKTQEPNEEAMDSDALDDLLDGMM